MKSKIVAAMDAAGYHFDELESSDDQLRFLGEYGTVWRIRNRYVYGQLERGKGMARRSRVR